MNKNRSPLSVCLLMAVFLFHPLTLHAAEKSVVVIPLNTTSSVQKELYVPASLFRPVTSMLGGSWQEDGALLQPTGAGYWTAPLLLPTGTAISSLQLYWKNNTTNTGLSFVTMQLLNLLNGLAAQTYTISSNISSSGVQTVSLDTGNFIVTESLKPSILVYLSNENRWLMGVKVVYK